MPFANFDALLATVAPLEDIPVAVVDAAEEHVLRGACDAKQQSIIEPILIGDERRIRQLLTEMGIPASGASCPNFQIIDLPTAV